MVSLISVYFKEGLYSFGYMNNVFCVRICACEVLFTIQHLSSEHPVDCHQRQVKHVHGILILDWHAMVLVVKWGYTRVTVVFCALQPASKTFNNFTSTVTCFSYHSAEKVYTSVNFNNISVF